MDVSKILDYFKNDKELTNMIKKILEYNTEIAQQLLAKNFDYHNKIDKKLRMQLMSYNNQLLNNYLSSSIYSTLDPKYHYNFVNDQSGPFGLFDINKVDKIVNEINRDGYSVVNFGLDETFCDNILSQCQNLRYYAKYQNKYINGIQLDNPIGITHWVDNQMDILYIPEVQELMMDPMIMTICREYFQTIPILRQTNFWWSKENKKRIGKKDNSQVFHQDQDDIKFIKLFIYICDVDEKCGPHVYVKESINNRNKIIQFPKNYKIGVRLTDGFINQYYDQSDIKIMTGKKGTMIFENTNGIHKGQMLSQGKHRLMLQLEWTCSLFWYKDDYSELEMTKLTDQMQEYVNR